MSTKQFHLSVMTEHQKFRVVLKELGLNYYDLATLLGMSYNSVKTLLAPSKELPKWAKTMIYTFEHKR